MDELLDSPRLPEIVDELQCHLQAERVLREKFYEEITDDQKAEFINGQVIMHSPALARHQDARRNIEELLWTFVRRFGSGKVYAEKALCIFPRNDYEPDICYFGPEKAAQIRPDTMKFPIPDFIVEILSESTEKRDRSTKFVDYQDHGVREYWIVDSVAEILEQYTLDGGVYQLALRSGSGEVTSPVVTGFTIPIRAIFDDQIQLQVARQWMA